MLDDDLGIYLLFTDSKIVDVFFTLEDAKEFAEGFVGHDIQVWDDQGGYYGTHSYKEGWVH